MLAMARDVLTCLSRCTELTGILIVSRTTEADSLAAAFATERFAESPDADLAQALTQATEHLVAHFNAQGVFVVPADVPGIDPKQVDALIRNNRGITLLPDAEHKAQWIYLPPPVFPMYLMAKLNHTPMQHLPQVLRQNCARQRVCQTLICRRPCAYTNSTR